MLAFLTRISKVFWTFVVSYIHQKFHQNNGKGNAAPIPRVSCSVLLQIRLFYLIEGSYLMVAFLCKVFWAFLVTSMHHKCRKLRSKDTNVRKVIFQKCFIRRMENGTLAVGQCRSI
jgi:Ni,Fe-hydrogenase I cytochrome b subunit